MNSWHIAQINVGRLVAAEGDPRVAGFFADLDAVNAIADACPGFVWRLAGEGGNATDLMVTPDPLLIVNLSVWESAEALFEFVYRSGHVKTMARRREWFERTEGAHQALWWVAAHDLPTVNDGLSCLWMLDRYGPTPQAFTFKARFPQPGAGAAPIYMQPDPWCVGHA